MIIGHNKDLPKNRFAELDKLENREHLDGKNSPHDAAKPYSSPISDPFYNAILTFPNAATGFPAAVFPLEGELWDKENEK